MESGAPPFSPEVDSPSHEHGFGLPAFDHHALLAARTVTSYTLSPALYAKARSLARVRLGFEIGGFVYSLAVLWLILRCRLALRFEGWACRRSSRAGLQPLIFAPVLIVALALFDLIPGVAAHSSALAYGISIQRWASWWRDWGTMLALEVVLGSLAVWLFYFILRKSPRRWWLYAWLVCLPIIVVSVFAEPLLIEPMFNRFAPLQEKAPGLVMALEGVAHRAGVQIPPERMFWMQASTKTPGMNAYVTGIGLSKRVVVWDTTIASETTPEIVAVFGHELGHYVLGHVWKGMAAFSVLLFVILYLEFRGAIWIFGKWGRGWGVERVEHLASLPALLVLLSILMFAADPLANGFSRWMEHRADIYGLEVTHGILPDPGAAAASSFQREGEASLADPAPDPMDVFWFYDHPPIPERIRFCVSYDPWAPGGEPEFVK